ncbi:MAG: hypothetical protein AB7F19_04820 [Candidatus Babeliales bacterium]
MNNKTSIMLAIVGCLTFSQLGYASGRDTTVKTILNCVGYVVGGCITGDITMGGAFQPEALNTVGVPVESFGVITRMTQKTIAIPATGKKIFSFTPTTGSYANQQIKAALYTIDLSQPLPADAPSIMKEAIEKAKANPKINFADLKTVTGAFRQGPDEQGLWTPFYVDGSSDTPQDLAQGKGIRLVIQPGGKVIAYLPSFLAPQTDGTTKKVSAPPLQLELGMTLDEIQKLPKTAQ